MSLNLRLTCVFLLTCLMAFGQDKLISGKVTSGTDKEALPGVSVLVKGTSIGTVTNIEGVYKINVPADKNILIFSYIGFKTQEVEIGSQSAVDFVMTEDAQQLSEVIVTAFGLEREKKALGFSVQDVKGTELMEARSSNVLNNLSGRIAGVQITSAGGPGSGSDILIRGISSVSGNNQPLVVIDGVPMTQTSNASNSERGQNQRYGGGISEINPDNIAEISVLKGANAAALYGSRAANGVILITTKSGKGQKGIGVEFNTNMTFERPMIKPRFQNIYGGGVGYRTWYSDGRSGLVDGIRGTDGTDESWGAPMDGRLVRHWWSGTEVAPLTPQPNNWEEYWMTGKTMTNNVAISGGNDKGTFRLSVGRMDQDGIMYNNDYYRNNFRLNSTYKFTDKLSVTTMAEYIKSGADNRRYTTSQDFQWHHRHISWAQVRDYRRYEDVHIQRPGDSQPPNWQHTFFTNPFFIQERLTFGNEKDRFLGNIMVNYQINSWLNVMARSGTDFFSDTRINVTNWERVRNGTFIRGAYEEDIHRRQETNSDLIVSLNKTIATNFSISAQVGGVTRSNYFKNNYVLARELTVDGIYNLNNNAAPPLTTSRIEESQVNSVFGSAQIGYKNFMFLEFTARNDWSSTLPTDNNSFFYPSVSASAVISDMIPSISGNVLSFAKLRASWAEVGNDAPPYQLDQTFVSRGLWNGTTPTFSDQPVLANAFLKPEITRSVEFGADFRFFNGRIGLDLTYYSAATRNQIVSVEISRAAGYNSRVLNAGEITNKGFEAMLSGNVVKLRNGFSWDIGLNFARNINEVVELADGLEALTLWSIRGASLEARVGQPYGSLYGRKFERSPDGQMVFNNLGFPSVLPGLHVIGNIVPDWLGGISNTFSYKGLSLTTLIDIKMGGDIYDMGTSIARITGVLEETGIGREEGVIGVGVRNVGTSDAPQYIPNDIIAPAQQFYGFYSGRQFHEAAVFDGSYVKLREMVLGYSLPAKLFEKNFIRTAKVSIVGRNLAMLFSNHRHVDPELSSANQGYTEGQLPSTRSVGFNLNVTF